MILNEKISELIEETDAINTKLLKMDALLNEAKKAWPENQIVPGAVWCGRDVVPPKGQIWSSDGVRVWLIWSDGNPISKHATAVKFWTEAYIPAAPSFISGETE